MRLGWILFWAAVMTVALLGLQGPLALACLSDPRLTASAPDDPDLDDIVDLLLAGTSVFDGALTVLPPRPGSLRLVAETDPGDPSIVPAGTLPPRAPPRLLAHSN